MTLPLVALAVPSVLIGLMLSGQFGFPGFGQLVYYGHPHHEAPNLLVMGLSVLVALGGFLTAWLMYGAPKLLDPKRFVSSFRPVYDLLWNKWYFDDLYNVIATRVYMPFAALSSWFDRTVIDGIVGLTAVTVSAGGDMMRAIQNGRVQSYLVVFFGAILLLAVVLMWMV
jgi:NADH-quinone oxidoreductase subunit L